jgi:hypothetical protein
LAAIATELHSEIIEEVSSKLEIMIALLNLLANLLE